MSRWLHVVNSSVSAPSMKPKLTHPPPLFSRRKGTAEEEDKPSTQESSHKRFPPFFFEFRKTEEAACIRYEIMKRPFAMQKL